MDSNSVKRRAAKLLDLFGINALGHKLQTSLCSPFIRAVNYHDIAHEHRENFERHLIYYSEKFANVTENDLTEFLRSGKWLHDRPGLILSFDDGMRSHFEIATPILEKYGFTGWFFVPTQRIVFDDVTDSNTLTQEQIRYLGRAHVVGSHTQTHCRMSESVPVQQMQFEINGSQRELEEILGRDIRIFCWVGGEEFTYSSKAAKIVKKTYDLGFMTNNSIIRKSTDPMQLQRTNIEAENPVSLVRFQLSGIMDMIYTPKRRRVNRITR